jgi:HlyD family secretion protein
MQKIKSLIKTKFGIATLFVIVAVIAFFLFRNGSAEVDSIKVVRGDFEKVVSISGKVIPAENVDLAFETSGTVAGVYKKVGDIVYKGQTIAVLDSSDVRASRDKANANLLEARAELSKIQNNDLSSDVSINKEQVVNSIIDAYTKSDDAVRGKVDQFFDDARTSGPEIKYTFYDYFSTKNKINDGRANIERELVKFEILANSLTINNYSEKSLADAKMYVQKVKSFLDLVSFAVNSFEESYTLTNSMIDGYRSDVSSARTNVNTALSNLISYEGDLSTSLSDISIQEARVKAEEANVRSLDAQVAKTVIVAPFTGIISVQNAKVGESVASNVSKITLISEGYQVEAYIPEVSISGIQIGNKAEIRLDAYDSEVFLASIIQIDPAETVRDGVSNYRVKLAFDQADKRILSGMTADVGIVIETRPDVILIPERSVLKELDKNYVLKKSDKSTEKVEVVLGKKDGKGNIEIISGVMEGDLIMITPESK